LGRGWLHAFMENHHSVDDDRSGQARLTSMQTLHME
jgi:hypothetical protein